MGKQPFALINHKGIIPLGNTLPGYKRIILTNKFDSNEDFRNGGD